jgi:hypothetical protein
MSGKIFLMLFRTAHNLKLMNWVVMIVYIYNPSYLGGRDRRIKIEGQPGKK